MGFKDMTQEQADTIGWMIAVCMFLLPLGWVFFHVSIGHAVFAITQGAFVILAITWVVGAVYRRSRSPELGVLVAALTYLVSCFLTNWIGALILARGWKH